MRLVTFQDKYVLDVINHKEELGNLPIYFATKPLYNPKEDKIYKLFISKMREALSLSPEQMKLPIWCWTLPKDTELTDEYLNTLYIRSVPKCNRLSAIELQIPKEFVFISNFELWEELRFKSLFKQPIEDNEIDKLFEKRKGAITQASIPFLSKDFIVSIKDYEDYINRDYSQTNEEIAQLQKRGEFLKG